MFLPKGSTLQRALTQALADLVTALCCQQFALLCTTEVRCAKSQQYFSCPSYTSCQSQRKERGRQAQKEIGTAQLLTWALMCQHRNAGFKRVFFPETAHTLGNPYLFAWFSFTNSVRRVKSIHLSRGDALFEKVFCYLNSCFQCLINAQKMDRS